MVAKNSEESSMQGLYFGAESQISVVANVDIVAIQVIYSFSRFGAQAPQGPNQPSKVFVFIFCYLS